MRELLRSGIMNLDPAMCTSARQVVCKSEKILDKYARVMLWARVPGVPHGKQKNAKNEMGYRGGG